MRPRAHAHCDFSPQLQIRDRRLVCVREARMVEQALALLEKHAPGPRLPPHPPRPARSEGGKKDACAQRARPCSQRSGGARGRPAHPGRLRARARLAARPDGDPTRGSPGQVRCCQTTGRHRGEIEVIHLIGRVTYVCSRSHPLRGRLRWRSCREGVCLRLRGREPKAKAPSAHVLR
jgi:hypothetical protein